MLGFDDFLNVISYCFRFWLNYSFPQKFMKRPTISRDFWHEFFKNRFLDSLKCSLNRKRTFWCGNKKKLKKLSKPSRLNQFIRQRPEVLRTFASVNHEWSARHGILYLLSWIFPTSYIFLAFFSTHLPHDWKILPSSCSVSNYNSIITDRIKKYYNNQLTWS